ncbi:hypothetical protein HS041_31660 [Planomonospora sp. ID67723]|uniref:hypothetical protein n=1 Tax=Planomonospora sp. ID67723 TaxID=2738134 RepID=UPI0018C3F34C|nr:hypothetical protein [Planomonospora sp. ID67723]MBG0832266.1 hypothetical protein [Planomonospora sp. ID67723]
MKRWVSLVAVVLIASVPFAVPAAAQTGPADPVQALKRQFRAERGVHIAEVTRLVFDEKNSVRFRYNGRVQLGPSGPVASDSTLQLVIDPPLRKLLEQTLEGESEGGSGDASKGLGLEEPHHAIAVGGYHYTSDGILPLPHGKTWVRRPGPGRLLNVATVQPIDVFEPAVLKTMLRGAKGEPVSGGLFYQGTVSYAQLAKASRHASWQLTGMTLFGDAKKKIAWRLWTDGTGLPTRLMTVQNSRWDEDTSLIQRTDTRYGDWGSHILVMAPPADEVVDEKELSYDPFDVTEPKELINTLSGSTR